MEMTAKEFRHRHLLKAIDEHGSIENLAKRVGLSPQYLSQLKNETRGIGHKTARKIEIALGWAEGDMDRPLDGEALDAELAYLLNTMPEGDTVKAIIEAMPLMSPDGIKSLTAALLQRLSAASDSQE
jgi:transcriptional regulator with XRE-family HTH domain